MINKLLTGEEVERAAKHVKPKYLGLFWAIPNLGLTIKNIISLNPKRFKSIHHIKATINIRRAFTSAGLPGYGPKDLRYFGVQKVTVHDFSNFVTNMYSKSLKRFKKLSLSKRLEIARKVFNKREANKS